MSDRAPGYVSEERLWDAARTGRYLGLSRQWVCREAGAGQLPHVRILGVLRFDPGDIRRLKEESRVVPGEVRPAAPVTGIARWTSSISAGERWYVRWKDATGQPLTRVTKTERLAGELEQEAERQRLGLDPLPSDNAITVGQRLQDSSEGCRETR